MAPLFESYGYRADGRRWHGRMKTKSALRGLANRQTALPFYKHRASALEVRHVRQSPARSRQGSRVCDKGFVYCCSAQALVAFSEESQRNAQLPFLAARSRPSPNSSASLKSEHGTAKQLAGVATESVMLLIIDHRTFDHHPKPLQAG